MRKVVIDTNVIVSASLSPKGNPARIIALIAGSDDIQLYYSVDILAEYTEVLSRPYLKISPERQNGIISVIRQLGILIEPTISSIPMPDESDRVFYDRPSGRYLLPAIQSISPLNLLLLLPPIFLLKHKKTPIR